MSQPTLRFLVGTARLRTRTFLRDLRGRTRRRPPSASVVPRPERLRRGRSSLRLTHALVASDLHPKYVGFWPLARRAWREVAGLEPVLVLVAPAELVPEDLRADPAVRVFEPLPGLHTAFQAQCIRLLYPALVETAGAVIVADVDMAPLDARYFHRPLARVPGEHFVAYRDLLLPLEEIPICYNAALPRVWGDVFRVATAADVRARLEEWSAGVEYAGTHGGEGWITDQRVLHRTLLERGRARRDVWILDDHFTGFQRLPWALLEKRGRLDADIRDGIARGRYSDLHFTPRPDLQALNDEAIELAVERARRRRARAAGGSSAAAPATRAAHPEPGGSSGERRS